MSNIPGNAVNTQAPVTAPFAQGTEGKTAPSDAKQAAFPSGNRSVASTPPTSHLQQSEQTAESGPQSTALADHAVEDITDQQPGKLRQAASLLRQAAADKWTATKQAGRAKVSSGIEMAKNPKQSAQQAAAQGADWARGKYTAAKSKGAAAAANLQQLKENPRETLAAGGNKIKKSATSLKARAFSLPGKINSKIPQGLKNHLPKFTALLSRQSTPVPPSASLQPLIQKATEKSSETAATLTEVSQELQAAKAEHSNVKTLSRLLDDPSPFYKKSADATVSWGEQRVHITGKGVAKAQAVKAALQLAQANRGDIETARASVDENLTNLRAERHDIKTEHRTAMKASRQDARSAAKATYNAQLEPLKTHRNAIKGKISALRTQLKALARTGRQKGAGVPARLKSNLQKTVQTMRQLQQQAKADRSTRLDQLKTLQGSLNTIRTATQETPASQKLESQLLLQMADIREGMAHSAEGFKSQREELQGQVNTLKDMLTEVRKKGVDAPAYASVEQKLEAARQELKNNTETIRQLRSQHRADLSAISKMGKIR
ncbi:MAG: hypothetical protein OXC07_08145 [Kistimonas sp.]|nr:hypothetical protein [Kistimonas sp.]